MKREFHGPRCWIPIPVTRGSLIEKLDRVLARDSEVRRETGIVCARSTAAIDLRSLDRMRNRAKTGAHGQRSVVRSPEVLKAHERFLLHLAFSCFTARKFALPEIREAVPIDRHNVSGGLVSFAVAV